MQNLLKNVSKTFETNKLLLKSAQCIAIRDASSLSKTNIHINLHEPWAQRIQPICASQLHFRCYSTENEEPSNQETPKPGRKVPKMADEPIRIGASPFSFITLNFKAFKMRKYDPDFSIAEFVDGSKKAVEIVSDKLAMGDFDGLRGLVLDDLIEDLREKISSWTVEQRAELRVVPKDLCKSILNDIEIVEEDDRILVKMSMVYHQVKGFMDLTEIKMAPVDFMKTSSDYLDDNLFILNYQFLKEFSKGANDDWIISYINHINIHDEMQATSESFQQMLQKIREKSQKK